MVDSYLRARIIRLSACSRQRVGRGLGLELEAAVGFGLSASARWQLQSGFFVTTAMASLQDGGGDASQSEAAEAAPCEAAEAVPSM